MKTRITRKKMKMKMTMMKINKHNLNLAIQWLKEDRLELDMGEWFRLECDNGNVELVSSMQQVEDCSCRNICVTSACLAGTIQYHAARTPEEREQAAPVFAANFLVPGTRNIPGLFEVPETYGRKTQSVVTRQDVIDVLEYLLTIDDGVREFERYLDSGDMNERVPMGFVKWHERNVKGENL